MKRLLAVLLLLSMSIGCSGQISQQVPAVVGSNGEIVNVTISLSDGEGDTYVGIRPRIGITTQDSIEQAVYYAYHRSSDAPACDVHVSFHASQGTEYIEGPSAGTALAVMLYALLENKTLRDDTIITGSVDAKGNVGPVGGLYEKAKGAALAGADYFITPTETLYEMLLLERVEERYGIMILEASTVDEVLGFMVENRSIEQEGMVARNRDIPSLAPYDPSGMGNFSSVADRMVDIERQALAGVKGSGAKEEEIRDFFENEFKRQDALVSQGYLFSAANEAFLNYIDISTISVILKGKTDLPRAKGDVGTCLSGIERPDLTESNFEWVVGSDLRQAWAYDKLDYAYTDGGLLIEEEFIEHNELMYGLAWCNVAKELIAAAPQGGSGINESIWKGLADERLDDTYDFGTTTEETAIRLDIAEDSYQDGRYGAAIYDAAYVYSMELASDDLLAGVDADEEVPSMLKEARTSLWGRIYQSHAAFLYEMDETESAYKTLVFAIELDNATGEMRGMIPVASDGTGAGEDYTVLFGVTLAISMFILITLLFLIRRGYGNQSKRYREANRAQKKSGRARIPQERP